MDFVSRKGHLMFDGPFCWNEFTEIILLFSISAVVLLVTEWRQWFHRVCEEKFLGRR